MTFEHRAPWRDAHLLRRAKWWIVSVVALFYIVGQYAWHANGTADSYDPGAREVGQQRLDGENVEVHKQSDRANSVGRLDVDRATKQAMRLLGNEPPVEAQTRGIANDRVVSVGTKIWTQANGEVRRLEDNSESQNGLPGSVTDDGLGIGEASHWGYRGRLNDSALIDARVSPVITDSLIDRISVIERKRHEAVQLATSQGWTTEKSIRFLSALDDQIRSVRKEYGDDDYERYLGAAGYPNRVVIGSPIEGAGLVGTGILPGDVIVSYDGIRVFEVADLRSKGTAASWVPMVICRVGEKLSVVVPSGLLGVALATLSIGPGALTPCHAASPVSD